MDCYCVEGLEVLAAGVVGGGVAGFEDEEFEAVVA